MRKQPVSIQIHVLANHPAPLMQGAGLAFRNHHTHGHLLPNPEGMTAWYPHGLPLQMGFEEPEIHIHLA